MGKKEELMKLLEIDEPTAKRVIAKLAKEKEQEKKPAGKQDFGSFLDDYQGRPKSCIGD